jgi:hypothetical protein
MLRASTTSAASATAAAELLALAAWRGVSRLGARGQQRCMRVEPHGSTMTMACLCRATMTSSAQHACITRHVCYAQRGLTTTGSMGVLCPLMLWVFSQVVCSHLCAWCCGACESPPPLHPLPQPRPPLQGARPPAAAAGWQQNQVSAECCAEASRGGKLDAGAVGSRFSKRYFTARLVLVAKVWPGSCTVSTSCHGAGSVAVVGIPMGCSEGDILSTPAPHLPLSRPAGLRSFSVAPPPLESSAASPSLPGSGWLTTCRIVQISR